MEGYLIVGCGHEGIDIIVGLFSKKEAVEKMTFLRNPARLVRSYYDDAMLLRDDPPEDTPVKNRFDMTAEEEAVCDKERMEDRIAHMKSEQFCVQRINRDGSKCVCGELGFELKEQWLY